MPPLPRFEKLPRARQQAILDAAAAEIAEHGLEDTSINKVLQRAGLSKSSFYYYFANKDDLYGAVVARGLGQLLAAMGPHQTPKSAVDYWAMWREMYVAFLERQLEDPTLARLNWSAIHARATGSAHPALAALAQRMAAWLDVLLRQGQSLGAVRHDLPYELLLHATFSMLEGCDRWFAEQWESIDERSVAAAADRIVDLLQSLLTPTNTKEGL